MKPLAFLARFVLACVVLGCGLYANPTNAQEKIQPLELGESLPSFALKDFQGQPFESDSWSDKSAVAVVFFGVECPIVKLSAGRLQRYHETLGDDVVIVGVNSNRHDSLQEMAVFAKENGITFPLLKDVGNRVADQFGAQRTPEVFLFDDEGKLCYRGAIDDQYSYGQQRDKPQNEFLAAAIKSSLAGKKPDVQTAPSAGCIIGRQMEADANAEVTYANQISRLLNERCVRCHRAGEVAPFELTSYEEVVGWAEMIAEVVNDRRMPPWHANPAHGTFDNDISLSEQQIELVNQWVKAGAPMGDESQLPAAPEFEEGWQIGKPDVVVAMSNKPYQVPATGVIPYQYFVVDPGFKEDKWIQAAECRIGNRSVVHHIIVAVEGKNRGAVHGQIDSEWITATAPGSPPLQLEDGFAKLIPAGSKLVFQMHYTPCGTPQEDLSKVGFKFVDREQVRKTVGTTEVLNRHFRIPPGDDNFRVEADYKFKRDSLILSMFPHMHLRGKSFRYTANYPDGRTEILLDIPKYDFNWQNGYRFEQPKLMPQGTVLQCEACFDNSAGNFANPDPTKTVRWGDQTWDEMMIGYFDMALADQDLRQEKSEDE